LILGFWTGIAGALYNMDWNLEFEVVSIRTHNISSEKCVLDNTFNTHLTHI